MTESAPSSGGFPPHDLTQVARARYNTMVTIWQWQPPFRLLWGD
jgi:hypothetical protein